MTDPDVVQGPNYATRLGKSKDEVDTAREALRVALERRDDTVRDADAAGYQQRTIATHAGISPCRVIQIIEAGLRRAS